MKKLKKVLFLILILFAISILTTKNNVQAATSGHYTYEENLKSIKTTGLKINNISHPLYPKRLFFITNIKTNTNISFNNYEKYLIDRLILNYRLNYKTNKTPNIYKISIDLNKLPNNIKFYIDINSYPYAIYTDSNIPIQYLNISKNKINIK